MVEKEVFEWIINKIENIKLGRARKLLLSLKTLLD
jgi:hypothetical protein